MKELNSAYQETFNYCITMLRSFLKKGDVSFDEVYSFARKHKLKYASAWFSILKSSGVLMKTADLPKGRWTISSWFNYADADQLESVEQAFARSVLSCGGQPFVERVETYKPNRKKEELFTIVEQPKANENIEEDLIDSAIKLLAKNGYNVFKFHWCQTSQVDANSVKVVGYYNLNQK